MVQQTGETRDAIIEDDDKRIQAIVAANQHRTEPYWIVMYVKSSKNIIDGKFALLKHIKPYATKPRSQIGMIIGCVDNSTGKISWEVNMPQKPFDFAALEVFGATRCDELVVETTTIADSYITQ